MRKVLIWSAIIGIALVSALLIVIHGIAPGLRETARKRTELYFETHFKSTVRISDFRVLTLYPQVRVSVAGIALHQEGRTDVPPIVEIDRVTFNAHVFELLRRQPVVSSVWIEGLRLRIPPRREGAPPLMSNFHVPDNYPVIVQDVHADDVLLEILPRDPTRDSRKFAIHHLDLGPVGENRASKFEATLTNPVPRGEIRSSGMFGPWNADDPAETPVNGSYLFENADFRTLKGLSGTMSSTGKFSGPLDYLSVNGRTDMPNFSLRTNNHPVPLHTDFSAIVDGTNGNVILKDVFARFRNSTLDVKGEVIDKTPQRGRTILLDAVSRDARVEDLLHLAVNADPPVMRGNARLRARIEIGEGNVDLIDKMKLAGEFDIEDAQFSSPATAQKIETLSLKGQGKPDVPPTGDAVSQFKGNFTVEKGLVNLSKLNFGVTGASVRLAGKYNLDSGDLDFRGKLLLQAKLSQTQTGVKSFFLKAIDPFFEGKNAGTVLPIKITGTKDQPAFALDFHDKLNHE